MKYRKSILVFVFTLIFTCLVLNQTEIQAKVNTKLLEGNSYTEVHKVISMNNEDYTVVGTDVGLNIIQKGSIVKSIYLEMGISFVDVIADSNNNGYDELLIITNSTLKNNILVYDTKDYTQLWAKSITESAYDNASGYYDQIINVDDEMIRGNQIIIIAGYHARAFSLTGEILWDYTADNNLWTVEQIGDINKDGITDYVVALQWSKMIALSGKNGHVIYEKSVTKTYYNRENRILMNIWDFSYDASSNVLFVIGEDGYIYRVNPKTGNLLSDDGKKQIYELDDMTISRYYYEGSGKGNYLLYKNFTADLIGDINGDGVNDLLYYENISRVLKLDYGESSTSALVAVSGKDLSSIYEIPVDKYGLDRLYFRGSYNNQQVIFLFDESNGYQMYSLTDGKVLSKTLNIYSGQDYGSSLIQDEDGNIAYLNQNGITIFSLDDGAIINTILKSKSVDFKMDGDRIYYLRTANNFQYMNESDKYASIETDQWTYQITNEDYNLSSGFKLVDDQTDLNKDGVKDFVILITPTIDNGNPMSYFQPIVITIDGKTGKELHRVTISIPQDDIDTSKLANGIYLSSYVTRFGLSEDLNHDGTVDFYFIKNNGEIYLYDLSKGNLLNYYIYDPNFPLKATEHYLDVNFNNAYYMNDINKDGKRDFVYFKGSDAYLLEVNKNNQTFKLGAKISTLNGHGVDIPVYNIDLIGDVDGDGIDDLYIVSSTDDKLNPCILNIISSKTGKNITSMNVSQNDHFIASPIDIDGDGIKEVIDFEIDDYNRASINMVNVVTGQIYFRSYFFGGFDGNFNQITRSTLEKYFVLYKQDDHYFLAVNTVAVPGNRYDIHIFDITENQLIRKVNVSLGDPNFNPDKEPPIFGGAEYTYMLHPIKMYTYQNDHYLYVEKNEMYYNPKTGNYGNSSTVVYNVTKKEFAFTYNGKVNIILPYDDYLMISDTSGQMFQADINYRIGIKNIKENQKINNRLDLKFNNDYKQEVQVYVDDVLVGTSNTNTYKLELLQGKHTIKISVVDENGIATLDSVSVEVPKKIALSTTIEILSGIVLLATIILPRKTRKYKRPEVVVEGSDVNE